MTTLERDTIVKSATRCTEAVCKAFGIEGAIPHYSSGVLQYLERNDFKCEKIRVVGTLRSAKNFFLNSKENFVIFTAGHVLAIMGGIMIDTAGGDYDSRRIESCWIVEKTK